MREQLSLRQAAGLQPKNLLAMRRFCGLVIQSKAFLDADKENGKEKPIRADFVGTTLPNRFVFGFGMDIHGAWRNLPAIYAVKEV